MWSKVFVGLLLVNIVTLAIWLALTESDSNGGGEVGKEGCLHVKQGTRLEFEAGQLICVGGCQLAPELPELLCTWGELEVSDLGALHGRNPFTCDFPSGPLIKLEEFNWTACDDEKGILLKTSTLTYSYHQGSRQPRVGTPTTMPALVLLLLFLIHRFFQELLRRERTPNSVWKGRSLEECEDAEEIKAKMRMEKRKAEERATEGQRLPVEDRICFKKNGGSELNETNVVGRSEPIRFLDHSMLKVKKGKKKTIKPSERKGLRV